MISLLWKLLYSSFNHDAVGAGSGEDKKLVRQFSNTTETTIHDINGTVTNICSAQSYGLINRGIYFHFDVVVGNEQLKIGDQVFASAERKSKATGFICSSVALLNTNWEAKQQVNPATNSKICLLSIKDFDPEDVKIIDGFVTEFYDHFGILDKKFRFFMGDYDAEMEVRFQPCVGDKITGSLVMWNSEERVIAWKPKTVKKISGVVTFHEGDWGGINEDIVYFIKSCHCDFPLVPELQLNAHVVESRNPPCFTWRAFSLTPYSQEEDCMVKPTVQESDDLYVDGDSDFLDVVLGETKCIRLILENCQDIELNIVSIHFQKPSKVCPFVVSDVTTKFLPANSHISVTISCKTTATVGRDSDLLIFEFVDFLLAHEISINFVDPDQRLLNPTNPYEKQHRQQVIRKDSAKVIIPGQKVFNPKANFKGFPPSFTVPKPMRIAIENLNDILQVAPVLNEELNLGNYCKRFSTLLHLEEIKMDVDMFQFSMSEVVLRRQRSFLVLEVPGLAEGRPSLMIGDTALLSPPNDYSNLLYEGYIHEVHQNDIYLKFNQEFQTSYNGETYDVSFQFSRSNMIQCHRCLHHVRNSSRNLLFPRYIHNNKEALIKVYLNRNSRTFSFHNGRNLEWHNNMLNFQQKIAIQRILEAQCRPFPYIVFGPPGTGKTVTLVEAVLQIYGAFRNARILICTPTNSAADLFTQRLVDSNVVDNREIVRLNSYQRSVESIPEFIKPFCQDKDKIIEALKCAIIISTCSTASIFYRTDMPPDHFTHVFIDEACQLTEPESMIAIGIMSTHSNGTLVMAGDPKQLGSVVQSLYAKEYGLQISYMERLMQLPLYMRNNMKFRNCNGYNPRLVTMLIDCYRMHPAILQYPSTTFYHSELKCRVPEERHSFLSTLDILPKEGFPIVFCGIQGSEEREESSPSWFNSVEIVQVTNYLRKLYANHIHPNDIGIITPYRKQVEKIRLFVDALNLECCKVGSVEEFQGQERRVIIISTVRSNTDFVKDDIVHNLGFLSNPKRFNVAITRAQELLIVIGNPRLLSQDENWETFIRYCQVNGGYTGWSPIASKD